MNNLKFDNNGLIPAIIQDDRTNQVLMMAYMNAESIELTCKSKFVTFFSRSRQQLWTKGETSGNYLHLVSITPDCDCDTLLVKVIPDGVTCHTGDYTCWGESPSKGYQLGFLVDLENVIKQRRKDSPESSYVASLFNKGINKIAQKVGEEAVEVVIESKDNNDSLFLNESADLIFHLMVLLEAKDKCLNDVVEVLKERAK